MDEHSFTHLVAHLRAAPLPTLPGSFRQNVWRTIRQRSARSAASWWAWFFEPLLKPAMAVAALTLAMIVGAGSSMAPVGPRAAETRRALGLEVFSPSAPALPTTLMAHAR